MMLSAFVALAIQGDADPRCLDPQTQQEMNVCAARDFRSADEELNRTWLVAQARAREKDRDRGPPRDNYAALLESQRAWLRYRDSECARRALPYREGTIVPLIRSSCLADLTRQRIEQLRGDDE